MIYTIITVDAHCEKLKYNTNNRTSWILRTFTIRDPQVMLTQYKSLVMYRPVYASQLWSPYLLKHVYLIEKVQKASYSKRLEVLNCTHSREGERDMALFMCGK